MTTNTTHQLTLLSDVSMQSKLFKDSLEKGIQLDVNIVSVSELAQENASQPDLGDFVLIDYHYLDDEKFEMYNQAKSSLSNNIREIVINCPKDVASSHLFKWRNLVGVFYVDDDLSLLLKGMQKIMQDEMWLSRKVAQDYIEHFRCANTVTTSQVYANLTKREKEIIRLLGHGASNLQIADELFVSENTVKTHLHNIFKKINAKNRLQALLWANNNIALEERV
ncbi:LuxR family transcriptional regulator, csgAB operon transcriptional regulatory protein [Vibrio xiamenensis]|uniref:LuxR family transcriptional regulator, csgAB operon transcriptional regulatory protein n=1 Tax=Vibrio xiamenensis TaxID=861298 RepID=A0A1G8ERR5_9VIBR|nr:LuxR C-terminal-related transcriptional regulator [Vibrio xiamenensis]SDH72517.1 LuxR family transcriptional regulator, csgAB operon transcriptional regulatory protein [Vibrio xiamenensis]